MGNLRQPIPDFSTRNTLYAGATVAVLAVDEDLEATATLAPLYAAPTGPALAENPHRLDSQGMFRAPVYVDQPFIMRVTRPRPI